MLVPPIQINGIQSIPASLGVVVVCRSGGHDGAQQIADCLMWCAAGHSRETAACFNRVVKVQHMNRKPIPGLWIQGSGDHQALSLPG